jgi:hypothetical protein
MADRYQRLRIVGELADGDINRPRRSNSISNCVAKVMPLLKR